MSAGSSEVYAGYEQWKGWSKPFTLPAGEAAYFDGEMRGLKIAGADVFEIGFGSGSFLVYARDKGARIFGSEINDTLLKAARGYGVALLPANFETVAERFAGAFDTVVAFDVFEHFPIPDIVARLKALAVMLRPDGHLILRFPNAQSPFGLGPQNGDPTHMAALSRSVFEQLIQAMPYTITRYDASYRAPGAGLKQRLLRAARGAARDLISRTLNTVYSQDIPWDPVVVLVLRRDA